MLRVLEEGRALRSLAVNTPRTMADLLQRVAANGDVEAFKALFEAYAPRVKSYMLRQGADAATAEELAQETLLAVWRKAGLYSDEKGSATTWIFTIARNLRIDRLRKEVAWQPLPENNDERPSRTPPQKRTCPSGSVAKRCAPCWPNCRRTNPKSSISRLSKVCPTARSPRSSICRSVQSNRACGSPITRSAMRWRI